MKKIGVKNLVLIGVLNALMLIVYMGVGMIMSMIGPITNVFYPVIAAVIVGIIMMLLISRVPQKGVFTISGIIQGLLFLLMGSFWLLPVMIIIGGILCDVVFLSGDNITGSKISAAFAFYSGMFAFGAIGPIRILQKAYIEICEKNNVPQTYIDSLVEFTSFPMVCFIVIASVLTGVIGAWIGKKMMKKHFIKAGLINDVGR